MASFCAFERKRQTKKSVFAEKESSLGFSAYRDNLSPYRGRIEITSRRIEITSRRIDEFKLTFTSLGSTSCLASNMIRVQTKHSFLLIKKQQQKTQ